MERYKLVAQLGDGSYGSVWKAVNKHNGEVVAVKRMKRNFSSWEECMALREVRSLRKLTHPCIVKLREVIRENTELFFIFEYMDHNLYQVMKNQQGVPFPEVQVKYWTYQILLGLDHMHRNGYFHRDMKPENLLVHKGSTIKIADFGLARETTSQPPYTEYVSTRWYRAPEVLLRKSDYSAPVDMFAVGAIMAELFTLKPLFPGSTEMDMIFKLCTVLGTFTAITWPEGDRLLQQMGFKLHTVPQQPLSSFVPQASAAALDLMQSLCQWDPSKRPTASQALQHPFFKGLQHKQPAANQKVLREKTNTAAADSVGPPSFQQMPTIQPAAAAHEAVAEQGSTAAISSQRRAAKAPIVGSGKYGVDYTPMLSSMRMSVQGGPRQLRRASGWRQGFEKGQQRSDHARHAHLRPGQPPDLWVNAKALALERQQLGFSQRERGPCVRQGGAWGPPPQHARVAPPFAASKGINIQRRAAGGLQQRSSYPAKKQCQANMDALAGHLLPDMNRGSTLDAGCLKKPAKEPLSHCIPDAKNGDFGPLSASLRRAAAGGGQLGLQ